MLQLCMNQLKFSIPHVSTLLLTPHLARISDRMQKDETRQLFREFIIVGNLKSQWGASQSFSPTESSL